MPFKQLTTGHPVIPVVTITSLAQVLPLADALVSGGVNILEVTLRSEYGLPAIEKLRSKHPEIVVGAGSIKHPADLTAAVNAGALFLVSPGTSDALLEEASCWDIPFLPGVMTPGEMLSLFESGFSCQKLFPVQAMGGIEYLKSLAGPLPEVSFCPSGGINESNFQQYLELQNVTCVSGSWLTPSTLIEDADWSAITTIAQRSVEQLRT